MSPEEERQGLRHLAAHGVVAAAMLGAPVAISLDGFSVPKTVFPTLATRIMVAGDLADELSGAVVLSGADDRRTCLCASVASSVAEAVLEGAVDGGAVPDRVLEGAEHDAAVEGVLDSSRRHVAALITRALETGLLDKEASRLGANLRITIDPIDVAFALDPRHAGDQLPRCPDPRARDTSPADREEAVLALAHFQAGMAVAEHRLSGGPVYVTLAYCSTSPQTVDLAAEDRSRVCRTVPFAGVLAEKWACEGPGGDAPPNWDSVSAPIPDSPSQPLITEALGLVKDHWLAIADCAQSLMTSGSAYLP